MTTTTTQIKTIINCGYTYLPTLEASDVWSVPAISAPILAPCEVYEDNGLYYFKTYYFNEVSGPYESELLACQCAAIHRNPTLQYPPKVERPWQERALQRAVTEIVRNWDSNLD